MATCLYNEFEQVMQLDEISEIKRLMMQHKALGASMSGSGSAVYAIFNNDKKAEACAAALKEQYRHVFITKPIKVGCTVE
jgi:4-diphosphocytidyl-2-C-methyl-D-erythritol kinase